MKKRLLGVFALVLSLALILTWAVAAQGPGDVEPPDEGGPYFPETYSGEEVQEEETEKPTPPQPERGQRPLPPSADELSAMGAQEMLGLGPLGVGAGPFDESYFYDGMESGGGNWTATGLWHIADAGSSYPNAYDGDASWWYGQEATGSYDTGAANAGAIETGPISIPSGDEPVYLRFWSWECTEDFGVQWDTRVVYTSTNGTDWTAIYTSTNSFARWHEVLLDLSGHRGEDVYLRFEFDTVDGSNNGYRGWYVDEVAVGYDRIQLFPSGQTGYGLPGQFVVYPWAGPMWIENNTGVTASFTITPTGVWTPTFPSPVGPVNPGGRAFFGGNVEIPPAADLSTYDDATLLVTSQATPTLTHSQTVRTWAGWVHHVDHRIIDDGSGNSQGDGDGQIDPGETVEMTVTLKNDLDRTAFDVYVWMGDSYGLPWSDNWEPYGDVAAGATANSFGRYQFDVPTTITPGTVITFNANINARGGGWFDTFTETVPNYLELAPDSTKAALPGSTVTHTLLLENWTGFDDSFDLSASGSAWPTTVTPDPTGVISNGDSLPVTVTVDIPPGVSLGESDVAVIQAQGQASAAGFADTATLTTTTSCPAVEGTSPTTMGDLDDIYGVSPTYIYVYVYSGDNDTLDATVWGYNAATASWDVLANQVNGGSGVLIDAPVAPLYSQVRVRLDDTEDNDDIYYDYRFEVCPPTPEVVLIPRAQRDIAPADETVTYTQRVFNATGITTAIDLEVVGNVWLTTLLSGTTAITQTDVLSHGAGFDFNVRVEVPDGADAADADVATIEATSATSPTLSDTAHVTTTAISEGWYQAYYEDYPTTPWADDEAYLDSINSFAQWQLTDDRDDEWNTAVSAFYRDRIPYAWTRGRINPYGFWVNEVEFGARNVTGTVVVSTTRVADHNYVTDNVYDYDPAIAVDPVGGNIGLAWTREDRTSDTDPWRCNVYYAVYDEDGGVVQPPTALTSNTDDTIEDYGPAIEAYRNGRFAVAWEHSVMTGGIQSVYYAVTERDGAPVKSPTELTPNLGDMDDYDPRLAQMLDGTMMVLWEGELLSTGDDEATYAILSSSGNVAQGETALTDYTYATTGDPDANNLDAVALSGGNTVVAWINDETGQIEYTVLDADYTTVVPPTVLTNTLSHDNWSVSLTEDEDGRAVFTWHDDNTDDTIYYALVDGSGDVVIEPAVYREARNSSLYVNWKGYGNGGMEARPRVKIYLPLVMRNH